MRNRSKSKLYTISISILIIFGCATFLNYFLNLRNIEAEFLDNANNTAENTEIKQYIEVQAKKNADSFLDLISLESALLTKLARDEYEQINRIDVNKKVYFNSIKDFGVKLFVVVIKNDQYFYACLEDKYRDQFLLSSMLGNSDGELYEEISTENCDPKTNSKITEELIKFVINPKALYSKSNQERISGGADSLSGMRIYKSEDFRILKEIIAYLEKNSFQIREVYINELKLAEIDLSDYKLIINMEKDEVDTITDFETVARAGKLQKYINEDRKSIEYIDLSYKNKVFFKLKGSEEDAGKDGIISTSTTQDAKEFLD